MLSYGTPREQKDPTVEHTFTTESSLEFIDGKKNVDCKIEDSSLHVFATDTRDPYFYLNFDNVSANEYKYLTVTLKPDTTIERDFKLGMFLSSGDNYMSLDNATYRGISYKNVKEYQTIVVDLSKMSAWGGQIHSVRFDLFDDYDKAIIGEGVYLKSVKFHKTAEEAENYANLLNTQETTSLETTTPVTETTSTGNCNCAGMIALLPIFITGATAVFIFTKKK